MSLKSSEDTTARRSSIAESSGQSAMSLAEQLPLSSTATSASAAFARSLLLFLGMAPGNLETTLAVIALTCLEQDSCFVDHLNYFVLIGVRLVAFRRMEVR